MSLFWPSRAKIVGETASWTSVCGSPPEIISRWPGLVHQLAVSFMSIIAISPWTLVEFGRQGDNLSHRSQELIRSVLRRLIQEECFSRLDAPVGSWTRKLDSLEESVTLWHPAKQ